jgi:hypothetical protein
VFKKRPENLMRWLAAMIPFSVRYVLNHINSLYSPF